MTIAKVPMTSLLQPLTSLAAALVAAALLTSCGGGGGSDLGGNNNYVAPQVTMTISNGAGVSGDIVITLASLAAPITTTNFLAYVNSGFYNGLIFHAISPGVFIQGGGYAGPVVPNTTPLPAQKLGNSPITLEDNVGLLNQKYTVAMVHEGFPDSATSQFFINLADNVRFDRAGFSRGYAVFGAVTSGLDLLTAMTTAPCVAWPALVSNGNCVPSPNLVIISARQTR